MTLGLSPTTASAIFLAMLQGTSFAYGAVWAQEHDDDPGADGSANVTGGSVRVDVSACFGSSPDTSTPGVVTILNDEPLGPFSSTSTIYLSLWSAEGGGTFICSGEAIIGADLTVAIGDCSLQFPVAA